MGSSQQKFYTSPLAVINHLVKWTLLSIPVSVITGSLVALFLWSLEEATHLRYEFPILLWGLPASGLLIYWLYKIGGKNAEAGNNLVIDEIHKPGAGVPARMAPLVLITTVITHLFGGSAGREGTAVQIGGSMAAWVAKVFKLGNQDVKIILMCGVAGGFGAVFGTPVTGAVFALEVLAIGSVQYIALLPCLITSLFANWVCMGWNIHHTQYHILFEGSHDEWIPYLHVDVLLILKVVIASIAFGLASNLFAVLTHNIKHLSKKFIKKAYLVPVAGGLVIILLTYLIQTTDYNGLGVSGPFPDSVNIVNAFHAGNVEYYSWLLKLVFTAITLGMGFKGGEVTPLFFIGATLGNTMALLLGAPVDLLAAVGFIAVFAGATNTPIACTLMGIELFGGTHLVYFAIGCFTAYYFSGHTGIYASQKKLMQKIV